MTRERRQSALPDPPANCGQVVASWTILCRSCSTTRTIMVASGQRAVDRAAAQRAWRRLGWVQPSTPPGGVQSTAALVLAASGKLDYPVFAFANTGDDSEHPARLAYFHEVAAPYAAAHGIELVELRRTGRGSERPLFGSMTREGGRSIGIPVRMARSGAPGRRACTVDFKIRRVGAFLRQRGATVESPALVGLGISPDEWVRANSTRRLPYERIDYPLLALRLSRSDCAATIAAAGLPVPPKSACWFCPFHSPAAWQRMRHEEPDLFARSVALEVHLNAKRAALGMDRVYLHDALRPLDQATTEERQLDLFDDGGCDGGWCRL